ncbi:hypothetical protein [Streptomyces chryseus]
MSAAKPHPGPSVSRSYEEPESTRQHGKERYRWQLLSQLDQADRILNEGAEGADPLRLMRLFGITEQSAMRYITAAHPE